MKPTFIGIGAQKCASSWLFNILEDHPEVCLSGIKEVNFFSYHYDNGYEWYERKFPYAASAKAVGEISPSYFHDFHAPERAARYDSNLKVIVSLREPIERAFSHHKFLIKLGFLKGPDFSFEAAMKRNPMYVEQGFYASHLSHWLKSFPPEQLLIIFMDDIKADSESVVRQVYRFLGIDEGHRPAALYKKANLSFVVRNRALDNLVSRFRELARMLGGERVWEAISKTPIRRLYHAANRIDSEAVVPPMLPETRNLLHEIFDPETERLFKLVGRQLPWTAAHAESRSRTGTSG